MRNFLNNVAKFISCIRVRRDNTVVNYKYLHYTANVRQLIYGTEINAIVFNDNTTHDLDLLRFEVL